MHLLGRGLFFIPYAGWGFLATSLLVRGCLVEPNRVEPSFHRIPTRKLKGRFRIVHLTDLHMDNDRRRDYVPRLVNAQDPDLILMTGDYLNRHDALRRLRRFVDQLDSKYGIYATFGNWDVGKEHLLFENTRVIPLRDARVELEVEGGRLSLVGIDKQNGHKSGGLLKTLDNKSFNILLHHTPDLIEDIAPYGTTDLYLAGHTHGGQVRVPFLRGIKDGFKGDFPYAGSVAALSKFGTKYESGRFQVEDTVLYVNRGVGMEGGMVPRVRLFCPPEIAVLDIDPQGS